MDTVLIVDSERKSRQELRGMIRSCGVPVGAIIACGDAETALGILKEQRVDAVFTETALPGMDGAAFCRQMLALPSKPLTVAVSGSDDFACAVELMRSGVRDYILKPAEPRQIGAVLARFEQELAERRRAAGTDRQIGFQQLKYLVTNERLRDRELQILTKVFDEEFRREGYHVCRTHPVATAPAEEQYLLLDDVADGDLYIVRESNLPFLLRNELADACVGISGLHRGIMELRDAFLEASAARRIAFCREIAAVYAGEEERDAHPAPEAMRREAERLLAQEPMTRRVQLVGTNRTEELIGAWRTFFSAVKSGRISADALEETMRRFVSEASALYRAAIAADERTGEELRLFAVPWRFSSIGDYEERFIDRVLDLQRRILAKQDDSQNEQKIRQAVEFLKNNYQMDLNMAVVSNEISMNYSLFSYTFKQVTGSNFVGFLKNIRMEEATKLLRDTQLRVSEIGERVGYDNEKHFLKLFKQTMGVTPSEYRKNMRVH